MDSQAILAVSAAVVGLVQLVKWGGLPDKWGAVAVLLLSLVGVLFWGWSAGDMSRVTAFAYFALWINISMSSAGIFGFTRVTSSAVSSMTPPPASGAGTNRTIKE